MGKAAERRRERRGKKTMNNPDVTDSPQTPATSALRSGSVRRVAVTERLVKKILDRARESDMGLNTAEASIEIGQYAQHNLESLALMLVSAWHEKYDLVSVFAAAMSVIEEEAQNE